MRRFAVFVAMFIALLATAVAQEKVYPCMSFYQQECTANNPRCHWKYEHKVCFPGPPDPVSHASDLQQLISRINFADFLPVILAFIIPVVVIVPLVLFARSINATRPARLPPRPQPHSSARVIHSSSFTIGDTPPTPQNSEPPGIPASPPPRRHFANTGKTNQWTASSMFLLSSSGQRRSALHYCLLS